MKVALHRKIAHQNRYRLPRKIVWCGDDENLSDASQHQHRDGVIHHRFVEDREELFAHSFGDGIEARAATSCQNDSFHEG